MLAFIVVTLAGVVIIGVAWQTLIRYLDRQERALEEHDCAVTRCAVARIDANRQP
jgi:hypothetical protein